MLIASASREPIVSSAISGWIDLRSNWVQTNFSNLIRFLGLDPDLF